MPYHVTLRRGRHRASAFNLEAEELQRAVVDPWVRGVPFILADKEWERRDSALQILEGPRLAPVDLAHGQGWSNAVRSARDVTGELLRAAPASAVAILAPDAASWEPAAALLARLGVEAGDWGALRRGLVAWLGGAGAGT
ncbi:MAG TPA: hypothetical protein VL977_08500, partial [Solirubrobacteraceae bacterium]|nr:hypothetical protein [Solirubrobacteraceae bacterium]